MSQTPPRLTLTGISKRYPSVVANDGVSLSVAPGEIHAILGENGAGKSTLMKIIYGAVKADAGEIRWNGQPVTIANPAQARKLGIGMVFQHFSLFETLTVVENIALVLDAPFDPAALALRVREVSERYGLPLDPHRLVHSLSVGERQRVEIVRCLLQDPKLLILDEPTSVLTPQAVQKLFDTLRRLASEGVSIVYISHKLHEIQTLCDSATILRGGKVTGEAIPRDETPASLARMMIGRELPVCEAPVYTGPSRPVLEIPPAQPAQRRPVWHLVKRCFADGERGRNRRHCRDFWQWPGRAAGGAVGRSAQRQDHRLAGWRSDWPFAPWPPTRARAGLCAGRAPGARRSAVAIAGA